MSEAAVISRSALHGSASSGSVLIIDDEAEIRESLQTLLEMEGFEVDTADSAPPADVTEQGLENANAPPAAAPPTPAPTPGVPTPASTPQPDAKTPQKIAATGAALAAPPGAAH